MAIALPTVGELARAPSVLNRPWNQTLTQSGYAADGSDFAGFAKAGSALIVYPARVGEVGVTSTSYPVGHVKRYGAVGDDVTNDTVAFQNGLASLAALGLKTLWVDDGVFRITTGLLPASGMKIRGNGDNQSILHATIAGGFVIYALNKNSIEIDGIGITGSCSIGIVFDHCTKVSVRRTQITGCTDSTHATGYTGAVHAWVCDDVNIEFNYFFGNGYLSNNPASSDIQINGNGVNTGSTRIRVHGNRCLSTNAQCNICCYDVTQSEVSGNIATGAKTGASNNNGYGILLYRTVNNSGLAQDNRVYGNYVYSVGGTGIYIQSNIRTLVEGNVIFDAGIVQDDTTLAVGGITFNSASDSIALGNVILQTGKSGIVIAAGGIAGSMHGVILEGNTIDTAVAGVFCIYIRGDATRCVIRNNAIKGGSRGIATAPVTQGIIECTIEGNAISTSAARGIDIYGISRSSISGNIITATGGDGLALVGGSNNRICGNQIFNGGTVATNTYIAIDVVTLTDCLFEGNMVGNTGGVGFMWGIYVPATCTGCIVRGNYAKGCLTLNYNVDTTGTNGFYGNYDAASAFPQFYGVKQQMALRGGPAQVTQLLMGDSSVYSALGTGYSTGDTLLTNNASSSLTADSWHQSAAGFASRLVRLGVNGDLELYAVAAGAADATFAAFWGGVKAGLTAAGQVKTGHTTFLTSTVALGNGAAAAAGTLANAPVAGNPTKWIPINDNGTTRYIPCW